MSTKNTHQPCSKCSKKHKQVEPQQKKENEKTPKAKPPKNCNCKKCQINRNKKQQGDVTKNVKKVEPNKEKDDCKVECDKTIDVQVDFLADAILKKVENQGTTFEIELDVASQPNCRVVKKEVFDPVCGKTITKLVLLVESDVKLDCAPKIRQIGPKPFTKFDLDVIVDTDTDVKVDPKEILDKILLQ